MMDGAGFEGNVFAGGTLDRAGHLRRDEAWLKAQEDRKNARFLPLWHLKALVTEDGATDLIWLSRDEVAPERAAGAHTVLLGLDSARVPHFAIDISARAPADTPPPFPDKGDYHDIRPLASRVVRADAALLAQARSLIDWHRRHQFCAQCGQPTRPRDGGNVRRCEDESCAAQHFPRTDPVVIMLVTHGELALLGRQRWFPEGFHSALAGFLEPGETVEEAVRREVMEEAGVAVGAVRYHSSQPWPYPSSLMIGCLAEARSEEITVDPIELEAAGWFDRPALRAAVEAASVPGIDPLGRNASPTGPEKLRVPAPMAIAHQLIRAWVLDEDY